MSDRLADLPPKPDSTPSPQEAAVLNKYFSNDGSNADPSKQGAGVPSPSTSKMSGWKTAAAGTVLFLLLANQYIDALFCKIPYCGNQIALLVLKAVLFFIALFLIIKFM